MKNLNNDLPKQVVKFIQDCISFVPVIVLGSGASAAYGIPGMEELAKYLGENINPGDPEKGQWEEFRAELRNGRDLEQALHLVSINVNLENEIIFKTKELISKKDIEIRRLVALNEITMPLSRLLIFLNDTASPSIKIVTTNYDRLAEYAIDQARLNPYTGFEGQYIKRFNGKIKKTLREPNSVEVLKVHGSLDWYRTSELQLLSLPDDFHDISELIPVIVTPGRGKYQHTHDDPFRSLITRVDELFADAKSIIIIGFGFNDVHIQPKLVEKMRASQTPILIISKELTTRARDFIKSNQNAKIVGIEEYNTGSKIVLPNSEDIEIADSIWDLKELLKIIL
ncbi:SIR2 family protein [Neobacillus sp. PS3-40]|uniref:SIR2 family protein n=1 Tax=Neobacillus sp. PS3-40 TaxID=3070679 RepID=UPI0027E15612|nr:SIR2 family protein [Neobacillus sp. PS3-40]WML45393.1 SIR2 family protein [Neobacillus sp. PS3-40]